MLGYERSRTRFADGSQLLFDESYRLAHLPLIAPSHKRVIKSKPHSGYNMGRHDTFFSLVVPLPASELQSSSAFNDLVSDVRSARLGQKISWDTFERRLNKIHATICTMLSVGTAPTFEDEVLERLEMVGPLAIKIHGLFSGNLNLGRLYLRMYPELRDGANMCQEIQRICDRKITDLYVAGIFNLIDELDIEETLEFKGLLERWWDQPFFDMQVDRLWLLKSRDDLVLDGYISDEITLV